MEQEKNERKGKQKEKQKGAVSSRLWVKWIALVLATAGLLGSVFFGTCTIAFGTVAELRQKPEEIQKIINEKLLSGYVGVLLSERGSDADDSSGDGWDGLDGGNIRYSVTKETGGMEKVIYTNDESVDADQSEFSLDFDSQTGISSNFSDSFWDMLFGNYSVYHRENEVNVGLLQGFYYAKDTGLFYVRAEDQYYVIKDFQYLSDEGDVFYTLRSDDTGSYYVSDEGDGTFLKKEEIDASWRNNKDVTISFSGFCTKFAGEEADMGIRCVVSVAPDQISSAGCSYLYGVNEGGNDQTTWYVYTEGEPAEPYHIYASVSDSVQAEKILKNGCRDYFPEVKKLCDVIVRLRQLSGWLLALSVIVLAAAFAFLMKAAGRRPEDNDIHLRVWDQVPFGFLTILAVCAEEGAVFLGIGMMHCLEYSYAAFSLIAAGLILAACICSLVALGYCMSIAARIKAKKFWRYTIAHYLLKPFKWLIQVGRVRVSFFVKAGVFELVLTFLELLICATGEIDVILLWLFLFKLVEIPGLIYVLCQLYQIREGGRRVANGNYSQPIDTRHMMGGFKEHADNINNVGNGISLAVEEKMKSERFKTELITNVSHDIKTPLTSIINYVDLMKKEEIGNPTVQQYIEVLDHQSARLKKLIEDLMEASKASTGNLPVHLEVCDATVMLTQVVGEFQERAQASQLDIVVESPEPPVLIMADGRHLWRIIDNLMSNICKYAQPGTRVYINLEQFNGMVIMTFRNISKDRLNIRSEDLMARFVRGDSSRNTEGNGLGLSIAKSLADLMDGNFAVQIDGDLFKVVLSFREYVSIDGEKTQD